jgi:hypothetical protein
MSAEEDRGSVVYRRTPIRFDAKSTMRNAFQELSEIVTVGVLEIAENFSTGYTAVPV